MEDVGEKSRTGDKSLEEGLVREIGIVLLKVLLGWRDELQSNKLVSGTNQQEFGSILEDDAHPRFSNREMISPTRPRY